MARTGLTQRIRRNHIQDSQIEKDFETDGGERMKPIHKFVIILINGLLFMFLGTEWKSSVLQLLGLILVWVSIAFYCVKIEERNKIEEVFR